MIETDIVASVGLRITCAKDPGKNIPCRKTEDFQFPYNLTQ